MEQVLSVDRQTFLAARRLIQLTRIATCSSWTKYHEGSVKITGYNRNILKPTENTLDVKLIINIGLLAHPSCLLRSSWFINYRIILIMFAIERSCMIAAPRFIFLLPHFLRAGQSLASSIAKLAVEKIDDIYNSMERIIK